MGAGILLGKGLAWLLAKGKSNGAVARLEGIFTNSGSKASSGGCAHDIVLVTNVRIAKSAVAAPVVGVDKTRVLYTFGENFGRASIDAIILTGGRKYTKAEPKGLLSKWESKSLVASKKPVALSWAGISCKVYITDIDIMSYDASRDILQVSMDALIAPVANKN